MHAIASRSAVLSLGLVVQVMKKPGQDNTPIMSEMDLTYKERYTEAYIPEAYERLILDAIRGDQQHFVRRYKASSGCCCFCCCCCCCCFILPKMPSVADIARLVCLELGLLLLHVWSPLFAVQHVQLLQLSCLLLLLLCNAATARWTFSIAGSAMALAGAPSSKQATVH